MECTNTECIRYGCARRAPVRYYRSVETSSFGLLHFVPPPFPLVHDDDATRPNIEHRRRPKINLKRNSRYVLEFFYSSFSFDQSLYLAFSLAFSPHEFIYADGLTSSIVNVVSSGAASHENFGFDPTRINWWLCDYKAVLWCVTRDMIYRK